LRDSVSAPGGVASEPVTQSVTVAAFCRLDWHDAPPTSGEDHLPKILERDGQPDAARGTRIEEACQEADRQTRRARFPGEPPGHRSRGLRTAGREPGCTPEELTRTYHRKVSEWHPDKLDTMAQELRDYATRRTARINEAYERLRSARV